MSTLRKYPKIQSVFNRDPETDYATFTDEFAHPAFELLKDIDWMWQEKVDGRCHRVMWNGNSVTHKGKRERSEIPGYLLDSLKKYQFDKRLRNEFGDTEVTLFGEAFGPKIQNGEQYSDQRQFILFDVRIGRYWLEYENVEDIANKIGVPVVPIIGRGPIDQAMDVVEKGFTSSISDCRAEGFILRPPTQLFDRRGDRIIAKLKYQDFH